MGKTVFMIELTEGEWEDTTYTQRIHSEEQGAIAIAKQLLAEARISRSYYAASAYVNVYEMPLDGSATLRNVFSSVGNNEVEEEVEQLIKTAEEAAVVSEMQRLREQSKGYTSRLGDFFPSPLHQAIH